jgi:hypothetical protein
MKAENNAIDDFFQSTDNFVTLIEQEVQSDQYRKVSETIKKPRHPSRETLYDYVLGWLEEDDADTVREHLAECAMCAREVLHIMRLEREIPLSIKPEWETWVKNIISLPSHLVRWVSDLWQPQWAGSPVTAADIPEDKKAFDVKDGEIEISCLWRSQQAANPAYIQISWAANFAADRELWALFFDPDTKEVLAEIPLGAYLEGGKNITSETLGFDPSNEKWAISILLKEREP